MPIAFQDEQGTRWTAEPSDTTVVFTSESGERRVSAAPLPEGASWDDVEDRIWRALLRYADAPRGQMIENPEA